MCGGFDNNGLNVLFLDGDGAFSTGKNWNYAWCADYFITVLTHERQCFFGEISDNKAQLSKIGEIVKTKW